MQFISHRDADYADKIARFERRAEPLEEVAKVVAEVVSEIRARGDDALLELARKFDGAEFSSATQLRVSEQEFMEAEDAVDEKTRAAIAESRENVTAFARQSLRRDWSARNAEGAEVGEIYQPFVRVGIYVPGGTAPLVSTSNMTVAVAAAAGVPEIVVCTPCDAEGLVNPVLLHALAAAGATEVYKLGGSQAIAAMAVGTPSIRPVVKVFGPGNSYVVEAKRQVFGLVGVDLLPGPSEILVLADATGEPAWIASDLLAQAEHGGDSLVGLITDSEELLEAVRREVEEQAKTLSRQEPIQKVLDSGCSLVLVPDLEEGVRVVNAFAPEHLTLISEREESLLPAITTAGAVFLGNYSPVAAGDFLAGPSHELPTGGAGKSFPGLTADQFQRRTSVVKFDAGSLRRSVPAIERFAAVEGLDAHGRSAAMRGSE